MKCVLVILIFLLLASCTEKPAEKNSVRTANPASKFCIENGYSVEIGTNPDGSQAGYCIFPHGECEEWKYYRGECSP